MMLPSLRPTLYIAAVIAAGATGACAPYPQRIHHAPVMTNDDKVPEKSPPPAANPAGLATATAQRAPFDATAQGQALIIQGDELIANGQFAAALDRYDRASVLLPNEPMVDFKIGRVLDLQMQQQEAAMRYRRFLHSLEIEKIDAIGTANAKLAEAIAMAQQRLMVIEKQIR
jgi:tetratricopeptide (TPR) repeat protein